MDGTGNCYEVHAKYMSDARMANRESVNNLRLVHGIVTGQGKIKGVRHGHCWVEIDGNYVYDKANGRTIYLEKDLYYKIGDIKEEEVKRYTYEEMRDKILETEHYGPWD